ncbi:MAG: hypothetical protein WDO16_19170 [Bacteroidota bacterium]
MISLWLRVMNDKRDLPFIYLLTTIHLTVLPVAIILFTPLLQGWWWWLAAIPYFYVSQLYFKGRFGLMFHCICHRKCFKKPYQWIHSNITWIVCPLFGHAPEGYFSHHMGMHHIENNMEDDTSSTMAYQRDSARGFLAYFFKFPFCRREEYYSLPVLPQKKEIVYAVYIRGIYLSRFLYR